MVSIADSFTLTIDTEYIEEVSVPAQHRYFFTYTITLTNPLSQSVNLSNIQLLLTDGDGTVSELNNPFQDNDYLISSQQDFCYSNDIITHSPLSIVQGKIELQLSASELVVITIEPFRLVTPNLLH
ncbi:MULTISPECIES: ApaG domain [unclassified Moritella]|uniref:ApaG domain-containing protein n=1 Tax=unclassified Moritella TaxID=2637987 RepID=UPI001BA7AC35|nr:MULTISPECIES: ApaG domain [unclassified Moritella]QUM83528.1 ApaG domain [Moritella sp. 28]QUM87833.1 ApaG domain [Moritella sp. 36]